LVNSVLELCKPLVAHIAGEWENYFVTYFPRELDSLCEKLASHFNSAKAEIDTHHIFMASSKYVHAMLRAKHLNANLRDPSQLTARVQGGYRKANRTFSPTIIKAMLPV